MTDPLTERISAVIDRWYHLGLIRFSSRDDGGDDLILRDELVRAAGVTLGDAGLRVATWRLSNAASMLAHWASRPEDETFRYWLPYAIADAAREVDLAREAAGPEPADYRAALAAPPPTRIDPACPEHIHVAGQGGNLDRCESCGHDLRELCHVRADEGSDIVTPTKDIHGEQRPRRLLALGAPYDDGLIPAEPVTQEELIAALRLAHDHHAFGPEDCTPQNCSAEEVIQRVRDTMTDAEWRRLAEPGLVGPTPKGATS